MAIEKLCDVKVTIQVSRHTEADVQCGKEPHDEEEAHVAKQTTITADGKPAHILFTWH